MLEVKNLKKRYGEFWAVQSATFSLNPGDIMGFIGSNGAGKTTTIKMLATLLEPTAGEAYLDGLSLNSDDLAVRRKIGYMPDFFGLYENIRVWEYLDMFATMYAVPKTERPGVIDQVLDLVDLRFKKDAMAQSLSRGMQQRLCLARCLVHDPLLLLLDEPASGLDPRARAELKGLISELGKMGKIVIVSSHILPELADFCTVVGIIERGEMMAFGPVEHVVKSVNQHKMLEVKLLERAGDAGMWLHGKEGVARTVVDGPHRVRIEFEGDHDAQFRLLQGLIQANFSVIEFREESADLEDLFMKVTTGALN
jgi:ABC-2 type transport system ATP-binding protein